MLTVRRTLGRVGRSPQPGKIRPPGPAGPRWVALRKFLFSAEHWGISPLCAACQHRILPGLGEVQHQVPAKVNPALAWDMSNMAPVHGGGRKRCPDCDLFCNAILAGNITPRDEHGRPVLPWPATFLAEKQRERQQKTGRATTRARAQADTYPVPWPPPPGVPSVGRAW